MFAKTRTVNPHYVGAPPWMSDGRLFTDYRANCSLLAPHPKDSPAFGGPMGAPLGAVGASFEDKQRMQKDGLFLIGTDRSLTAMKAGTLGCVDTMVPELTKRVCGWDGCTTLPGHPAGIGQGRLYLPGRPDLAHADPDRLAAETAFAHGTFLANPNVYMAAEPPVSSVPVVPARPNRYSAPYGN
jgi:hypothetical protein